MKQSAKRNAGLLAAFFASVFMLPLIVSAANGQGLEYYGVESTINEDMTVKTTVSIKFMQPVEAFEYVLAYKAFNLTATSSFDSPECGFFEGKDTSRIVCSLKGMTEAKNLLTLTFYTKGQVTESRSESTFSSDYSVPYPIKDTFIMIRIPKNSALSKEPANQSYSPSDGKTLSDGKYIMVYWQQENLTLGSNIKYSVSYAVPISAGIYSNLLVVAVAAIVIISMISVAIYVRRGSLYAKTTTEVIASVLNSDEKKVVDILVKHGGKSGQKIIVRESDFSKAKVSRLVKNLKERGVVDIEPISGRENRIILKFEKKPEIETQAAGQDGLPTGAP